MPRMSLARVWRRQLLGASSVALMVPAAMLAAVVALDLGGGFSQVRVLGQIFAGPPVPGPFEVVGPEALLWCRPVLRRGPVAGLVVRRRS